MILIRRGYYEPKKRSKRKTRYDNKQKVIHFITNKTPMTQILNVPIPADEAIKIIRSMYQSNKMINIEVIVPWARGFYRLSTWDNLVLERDWLIYTIPIYWLDTITINSITPIIPTYSVWQEVMILATGEIGSISKLRDEAREKPIEINNDTDQFYHRSEICKIV